MEEVYGLGDVLVEDSCGHFEDIALVKSVQEARLEIFTLDLLGGEDGLHQERQLGLMQQTALDYINL